MERSLLIISPELVKSLTCLPYVWQGRFWYYPSISRVLAQFNKWNKIVRICIDVWSDETSLFYCLIHAWTSFIRLQINLFSLSKTLIESLGTLDHNIITLSDSRRLIDQSGAGCGGVSGLARVPCFYLRTLQIFSNIDRFSTKTLEIMVRLWVHIT